MHQKSDAIQPKNKKTNFDNSSNNKNNNADGNIGKTKL
jgi:hypothetical protein